METTTLPTRFRKYGAVIVCFIPSSIDRLKRALQAVRQAEAALRTDRTPDNNKAYATAKDTHERIYFQLLQSVPDEICMDLWERHSTTRNSQDRKTLRMQYNELAAQLNQQYKRKIYLLIH